MVPDSRGRTPQPGGRSLSQLLRHQSAGFVDLVASMLVWDPTQRITPQEAAQHPWMVAPDAPFRTPAHARPRRQTLVPQFGASRGARGLGGADAADGAGLQAVQLAQLHWERHSLAKQEAADSADARTRREPLAESGNVPHVGGTAETPKRPHVGATAFDAAIDQHNV